MKKIMVSMIVLAVCLFAIGSGAEDKPKRVMNFLAVMDMDCDKPITKKQCGALTDVVIDELVKVKKYTIIDRANRDKILGEAGFQQTGCVDERCTIEAGRILGVGKIVVGKITKLGEAYLVTLQLLNVETAAVETSAKELCKKCGLADLVGVVTNTARKLMGQATTPATSTSPSNTEEERKQFFDYIKAGNLDQVKTMLSNNPKLVNAKDPKSGYSPLVIATQVEGCRMDIVKLLIDKGANVNASNGRYASLSSACHFDCWEIASRP